MRFSFFTALFFLLTLSAPLGAQDIPASRITLDNLAEVVQLLRLGRGVPTLTQFSPDGQTLAVGSSIGLWLYDMTDLTAPPQQFWMDIPVTAIAFSPAGGLLAVGAGDGTGRVFERASNRQMDYIVAGSVPERGAMANFNRPVSGIAFSTTPGTGRKTDGSGALSSTPVTDSDGAVLYLDVSMGGGAFTDGEARAGGLTAQIVGHEIRVLTIDDDTEYILAGFTQPIDYATMDAQVIAGWVAPEVVLPESALMTIGNEGQLSVWDVDSGALVYQTQVEATPSDVLAATWGAIEARVDRSDGSISVTEGDSQPYFLMNPDKRITALAFRPDGVYLAAGEFNSNLTLWDVAAREVFTSQYAHFGAVMALAWSPDGVILYSGGEDNRIFAWEITDDQDYPLVSRASLFGHAAPVRHLWALADGTRLVSVSQDGTAVVWGIPD